MTGHEPRPGVGPGVGGHPGGRLVVRVCGVRGSTPAPGHRFAEVGGNTSSVAIGLDDGAPSLLLDAGTGIGRVSELLGGHPFSGTVLLTHLHWDHVQGLPFFGAADRDGARTRVLIPEQDGGDAEAVLARALSPPHFPIGPDGLNGGWSFEGMAEGAHELEGVTVSAIDIIHKGGRTYGFRVEGPAGGSIAYLPDHAPLAYGDGPSGLGEIHDAALALTEGVDVLIHDAQFTREELALARAYGHSTIEYALALAERSGVGRLMLTHHSPARTDSEIAELARRYGLGDSVEFATEGTILEA